MWNIEKIVSKGSYTYAVVTEHPKATVNGYVLEHRIIMENYLERLLDEEEVVHHCNGNRKDNDIENLELYINSEHVKLHSLMKGRLYVELECPNCYKHFHKPKNQSFIQKGCEYSCCSLKCRGQFSRSIQLHGRTYKVEKAISGNLVREYRKYHDNREEID